MIRVIETNVIKDGVATKDVQSRIVYIDNWEEYCDKFRNYNGNSFGYEYKAEMMSGCSMPQNAIIFSLDITDRRIIVNMKLWDGMVIEHYSYRVDESKGEHK